MKPPLLLANGVRFAESGQRAGFREAFELVYDER